MMDDGTIGEICLFAGNFAPKDWAFCDGQVLDVRQNMALYSILGNAYGGEANRNFAVPMLAPLMESDGGTTALRYVIRLQGNYLHRP
jgi:microcystin-dependent protein